MSIAFQDDDTVFDDTLENSLHFCSPHLQRNFTPILPCQAINGQHFNAQALLRHQKPCQQTVVGGKEQLVQRPLNSAARSRKVAEGDFTTANIESCCPTHHD
jgi:hypothetical protein